MSRSEYKGETFGNSDIVNTLDITVYHENDLYRSSTSQP